MVKEFIMLKCLDCGHIFKSNVETKQARCSKCGKSKLLRVDKIRESLVADVDTLKKQMVILEKWVRCTIHRIGALEEGVNGLLRETVEFHDVDEFPLEIISKQSDELRNKYYEEHRLKRGTLFDKEA